VLLNNVSLEKKVKGKKRAGDSVNYILFELARFRHGSKKLQPLDNPRRFVQRLNFVDDENEKKSVFLVTIFHEPSRNLEGDPQKRRQSFFLEKDWIMYEY